MKEYKKCEKKTIFMVYIYTCICKRIACKLGSTMNKSISEQYILYMFGHSSKMFVKLNQEIHIANNVAVAQGCLNFRTPQYLPINTGR